MVRASKVRISAVRRTLLAAALSGYTGVIPPRRCVRRVPISVYESIFCAPPIERVVATLTYFIRMRVYVEYFSRSVTGPHHAGRPGFLGVENTFERRRDG